MGYRVSLIFLALPHVEMATARVAERVRQGGHAIPPAVIHRRFHAGWHLFETLYKSLVDDWMLFDNAGDTPVLLDQSASSD